MHLLTVDDIPLKNIYKINKQARKKFPLTFNLFFIEQLESIINNQEQLSFKNKIYIFIQINT